MLGETVGRSCGLGSGVEGCLSKGTGPWGTAKTTNIFCAFQIYQGQAIPLPFSLWGPGVLGHETQPDCLGETFFFTIHVMARSHLETSAPWVKVQGLVSPKHAQVSLHVCINIYIYTHMCVCVYIYALYLSGHLGCTSLDFLKGMAHMEERVQEQVTLEQFNSC